MQSRLADSHVINVYFYFDDAFCEKWTKKKYFSLLNKICTVFSILVLHDLTYSGLGFETNVLSKNIVWNLEFSSCIVFFYL